MTARKADTRTTLEKRLKALRSEIIRLQAQRVELQNSAIPKAEALQRLDDWIEYQQRQYQSQHAYQFSNRDQKGNSALIDHANAGGHIVSFGNVEKALIWLFPDIIRARLAAEIEAYYENKAGVPDDECADQLAAIDTELLQKETEEEKLIDSAEAEGIHFPRRRDADPRALVLACE